MPSELTVRRNSSDSAGSPGAASPVAMLTAAIAATSSEKAASGIDAPPARSGRRSSSTNVKAANTAVAPNDRRKAHT